MQEVDYLRFQDFHPHLVTFHKYLKNHVYHPSLHQSHQNYNKRSARPLAWFLPSPARLVHCIDIWSGYLTINIHTLGK